MTAHNGSPYALGSDVLPGASKLLEEMGEVQQVLGKFIATGGEASHWDGTNLRDRLVEELGDLSAAILFFSDANLTAEEAERVNRRGHEKYALFAKWHEEGAAERGALALEGGAHPLAQESTPEVLDLWPPLVSGAGDDT